MLYGKVRTVKSVTMILQIGEIAFSVKLWKYDLSCRYLQADVPNEDLQWEPNHD